jgi:hypothetical protein
VDEEICDSYDSWVEDLPTNTPRGAAIKDFFSKSEPIGMSNNYGQNRPAFQDTPAELAALTEEFNASHTFQDIRFISCAIATTIRARHRSAIQTELTHPVNNLGTGSFYAKHKDTGEMRKLNQRHLAQYDAVPQAPLYRRCAGVNGEEHRYVRVQRSERTYSGPTRGSLGILLNLEKCRHAFEEIFVPANGDDDRPMDAGEYDPDASGERMRGHGGGHPRYGSEDLPSSQEHHRVPAAQGLQATPRSRTHSEYPIGFMRNCGNIQTNSPLPYLRPILNEINDAIRDENAPDPVWNPHSQGYGEHFHFQNNVTKSNDLARGDLTAIYAGAHFPSTTPAGIKCARILRSVRDSGLPYTAFERKLESAGENIGMRIEPTLHIDLDCIAPRFRTGTFIYTNILMKASGGWATPENCSRIIDAMVIFKPGVFPACILSNSYPLQCAMDAMFKAPRTVAALKQLTGGRPGGVRLPWTQVELMSTLERLMMWASSGDNRVLPTRNLRQLFVFEGLQRFTWPMFAKSLELHAEDGGSPDIRMEVFPQTPSMTILSSARASIVFRYGWMAAEVRHFSHVIFPAPIAHTEHIFIRRLQLRAQSHLSSPGRRARETWLRPLPSRQSSLLTPSPKSSAASSTTRSRLSSKPHSAMKQGNRSSSNELRAASTLLKSGCLWTNLSITPSIQTFS